jgi:hypothetical protein
MSKAVNVLYVERIRQSKQYVHGGAIVRPDLQSLTIRPQQQIDTTLNEGHLFLRRYDNEVS